MLAATVRRWFGPAAGLLAGALLALTPVAVLMFRFNNPDALMTLLIVLAAYFVTRAVESASTRWLLLAGLRMGLSFLAKGLQPFTVLPALALVYLVAAPAPPLRRLRQLLAAGGALLVGAGWWVLAVSLTPAADRPYIGGSGDNTALGLAFGYNGLSRLTGDEGGPGGGAGGNFSGATGVGRLFNSLNGGQIAWLLPAALVGLLALAVVGRSAPRTDRTRAAALLWGGWLLVTGAVLSFAGGIVHTYYTVELAPAIAALVAIGAVVLWRRRAELAARVGLAAGVLITAWWSLALLHRSSGWLPWLATLVLVAGVVATAALLVPGGRWRPAGVVAAVAGLVAVGGGTAAYALDTAATTHTGSVPSAGPAVSGGSGRPGARGGFGRSARGGFGAGEAPTGAPGASLGDFTGSGGTSGAGGFPGAGGIPGGVGFPGGGAPPGGADATGGVDSALAALLGKAGTTWAAATVGSQSAASLELASGGQAVMAIGGWSGSDPTPTLARFEQLVAAGRIHYFVGGGRSGGGPGAGSGTAAAITSWVESHYSATTVGGSTVYDLTRAASS